MSNISEIYKERCNGPKKNCNYCIYVSKCRLLREDEMNDEKIIFCHMPFCTNCSVPVGADYKCIGCVAVFPDAKFCNYWED